MLVRDMPGCTGCPLRRDGSQEFVPDELRDAEVLVYGSTPVIAGAAGVSLQKHFLPLAGLSREQCSFGTALRCRTDEPTVNDTVTRQALNHCTAAHHKLPVTTRVVVTQGAAALWALTGEGLGRNRSLSGWRGYALPYQPPPRPAWTPPTAVWQPGPSDVVVLPTLTSAALMGDMSLYPAVQHDWSKVAAVLRGEWPQPVPPILVEPPAEWPQMIAWDTEYHRETKEMHRFSVAGDGKCWVIEASRVEGAPTCEPCDVIVTQNAPADWPYIERQGGRWEQIEDTMLAHTTLWSDMPHDLGFLGSLYGVTNRWKHLAESAPVTYAGVDAWNTLAIWRSLAQALSRDARDAKTYDMLRSLWPMIWDAQVAGQRVERTRARQVARALRQRSEQARLRAQAVTGWPLNLASPHQVRHELYVVEGVR